MAAAFSPPLQFSSTPSSASSFSGDSPSVHSLNFNPLKLRPSRAVSVRASADDSGISISIIICYLWKVFENELTCFDFDKWNAEAEFALILKFPPIVSDSSLWPIPIFCWIRGSGDVAWLRCGECAQCQKCNSISRLRHQRCSFSQSFCLFSFFLHFLLFQFS